MPKTERIHASAVVLGNHGVIIMGLSGAGKSSLARRLIDTVVLRGNHGRWVADDQVDLVATAGRVIASCPKTIAGQSEMRFLGVVCNEFEQRAVIDLAVELVDPSRLERLPEPRMAQLPGAIPLIGVPIGRETSACDLILERLKQI